MFNGISKSSILFYIYVPYLSPMKYSRIYIIACIPLLLLNLYAVTYGLNWLATSSLMLAYLILLRGFSKKLDFSNLNILCFIGLSMVAVLFNSFQEDFTYLIVMFFNLASYIFLAREALKFTKRETATRFMLLFFFILIASNIYFVYGHLQELDNHITSLFEFAFYSMYYINLLILAVVALIYYLNSYSRKSVFLISLVMAIIVADMLRDIAFFYMPDTSVLILKSSLNFGAIVLAFQFYGTEEKKLKLINLV